MPVATLAIMMGLLGLLNACTSSVACAAVFPVLSMYTLFLARQGTLLTVVAHVVLAALLVLLVQGGHVYWVRGILVPGLVFYSLSAFFVSSCVASAFLLRRERDSYQRLLTALLLMFVLDAALMSLYLMAYCSADQVLSVFFHEMGYRLFFTGLWLAIQSVLVVKPSLCMALVKG